MAATLSEADVETAETLAPLVLARKLEGHRRAVSSVRFSPPATEGSSAGRLLASASADRTIKVWNVASGSLAQDLVGHAQGVSDVAWGDRAEYVASASDDGTVRLWDVTKGECVSTLRGHASQVMAVAFSPRGNLVASGGFDDSMRLWDARSGSCLRVTPAHSDPVVSVAFAPDGSLIATGSYDGLVRVWDTKTGHCLATLVDESSPCIGSVQFSPNGLFLLVTSLDSTVRLWDYAERTPVREFVGHSNTRYFTAACMLTSSTEPAAHRVACASEEDNSVVVWSLQTGIAAQRLVGHGDLPIAVDAHPLVDAVATGCLDRDPVVRIWAVRPDDLGVGSPSSLSSSSSTSSTSRAPAASEGGDAQPPPAQRRRPATSDGDDDDDEGM